MSQISKLDVSELDFAEDIEHINHKLDGILGNAMLKNLSDLKQEMARYATSINCNLIHSFRMTLLRM